MTPRLQQPPKQSLLAHPCMSARMRAGSLLHRDIKLENLFISSRGHLQLGDFGLAISVLEERAISPVGTLEYMAPEILRLPSTGGCTGVLGCMRAQDSTCVLAAGATQREPSSSCRRGHAARRAVSAALTEPGAAAARGMGSMPQFGSSRTGAWSDGSCCAILCCADLVLKGLVRVEDISPIDEKVDVWSFGVTVYELVTGACEPALPKLYQHCGSAADCQTAVWLTACRRGCKIPLAGWVLFPCVPSFPSARPDCLWLSCLWLCCWWRGCGGPRWLCCRAVAV